MNHLQGRNPQNGMVLMLCLVFLTALTMIGLSAAADSVIQNRLLGNFQDSQNAQQSTESGLIWAEQWLLELETEAPEICQQDCSGLYLYPPGNLTSNPEFESLSWWQTNGHVTGTIPGSSQAESTQTSNIGTPAYWIIEELHRQQLSESNPTELRIWYRILSRGSSSAGDQISVSESIINRPWGTDGAIPSAVAVGSTYRKGICAKLSIDEPCGRESWRKVR